MPTEPTNDEAMPLEPTSASRRFWLQCTAALTGLLATAAAGVPIFGYVFGSVLRPKEDQWKDLGPIDDFPIGQTRIVDVDNPLRQPWDGDTGRVAAYVRRIAAEEFQVFAINCTHLGCPVSWFPASGLFLCPCHGGVYYENGAHASGPPPRGLYEYQHRVEAGHLEALIGHLPTLEEPA